MSPRLLVLLMCWTFLAMAPAHAATGTQEDVANDIAGRVISPFCPGVTLHDCPSGAAADLRSKIAAWAEAGWGRTRIMARLEADYGPAIRAVPPASGTGLVAWVMPAVVLAAGAGIALALVRRWSAGARGARPGEGPEPNSLSLSPSERRRLDDELAAFKGR
ncbi:MAG: cytochrome c-type biogenesis protein CcmH [Actinomycetota bacterium]|nr:cytochrome c-type biogenesis protein CcmH [Actinomycetota bacterium]